MALKITLGKNKSVIVNGAVITNAGSRATIVVENKADIIRASEIIQEEEADTPVKEVYFLIQSAIIHRNGRGLLHQEIQKRLAVLVAHMGGSDQETMFKVSNLVSKEEFFKALMELKVIIEKGKA